MTQPTTSGSGAEFDASAVEPKKPEKSSLLDDFMDIFYAPSSVFARRENANFWIPLLIIAVLLGVIFIANRDLYDPIGEAEFARAMAKRSGQMTADQIEAARKFSVAAAPIFAFIGSPFAILFLGIVIWVVGKFFDAKQTLNAAIGVATFSYVPRVVEGIVNRVQGFIVDPASLTSRFSLSLGVGRFLDPDTTSPLLLGLVGRIDVFTIWITVLIAIGLAVTGKITRGRAAIAAAIVWLVGALPTVLPAAAG
jgi:hypothetical protein